MHYEYAAQNEEHRFLLDSSIDPNALPPDYTQNQRDFVDICNAEGLMENMKGSPDYPLSTENHVGLNTNYTDFAYGIDLSCEAEKAIGFKLATLGKLFIFMN